MTHQDHVKSIIRKAANVVSQLAHPSSDYHVVYELASFSIGTLLGAIGAAPGEMDHALNQLDLAIQEAVKDSPRRD